MCFSMQFAEVKECDFDQQFVIYKKDIIVIRDLNNYRTSSHTHTFSFKKSIIKINGMTRQ